MSGINIVHFGALRLRVVGSGNLRCSFLGFNDIRSNTLLPISMNAADSKERTRIANFNSMFAKYKIETTAINEVFKINDISVYVKQIYSEYPNVD